MPSREGEMARRLRFIPSGALVEVTCRTLQGRFLLKPTPALRQIILGLLGRAQQIYGMTIHAFVFLGNHYHLLVSPNDAQQLARFMNYVQSNLAREAGRLYGWREKFWSRRYTAIVVSEEAAAQVGRLRYLLAHGAKEGLVARPQDWPGAHCVEALLEGKVLEGVWFNRTKESAGRRRKSPPEPSECPEPEVVTLSPLPCWAELSPEVVQGYIRELVEGIEEEVAALRQAAGKRSAGLQAILRCHPQDRPEQLKKGPAPLIHAASQGVRRRFLEAYRLFVQAYRRASKKLRSGDLTARFPEGCFPPALPYVPEMVPG